MSALGQSIYWHAATGLPAGVYAGQSLSIIDCSKELNQPFLQQNLALHVHDQLPSVQQNRMQLLSELNKFGATRLCWLNQTHSTIAHHISDQTIMNLFDGDGLVTSEQGVALMMMTADCLPIVVADEKGTEVACIHAGWRGLADGIIETTLAKMLNPPRYAWIGAAISQQNFEVGVEVKARFEEIDQQFCEDFLLHHDDKYLADLYGIARKKLLSLGVVDVQGADRCSFADAQSFYSYRRHSNTGRMATFVFIQPTC